MMKSGTMIGVGQLVLLGLGVALLSAQQREPLFRTTTRLVELTVTVSDKKGNAVTGLGPADFVVRDEGKPRPVDVFRFDGGSGGTGTAPAAVALAPGTFTNLPALSDAGPRNVTALVLDNITMTPTQGVRARALMLRYLTALAPRALTAVYLMSDKVYVLHDFTDDQDALFARIRGTNLPTATAWDMDYRRSIVEAEAFVNMFKDSPDTYPVMVDFMRGALRAEALADAAIRRDWMERSLAGIEAMGKHLAGIPGRKSVVWIGGGLSWVSVTATTPKAVGQGALPELMENSEEKVRQVARRLAQQGIVLYIVDAHYLEAPSDTTSQSRQPLPQRGRGNFEMLMDTQAVSSDTEAPMQAMASVTGGRYFHPGDASGTAKILGDMQGSYTLGFYTSEKPDDKWHKLKVEVKRPGVNVRHREGYLADSRAAQAGKWTDDTWRSVLSNPLGSPAIPLTASCRRTASGELAITVIADTGALQFVPSGSQLAANLEILVADRTPEGPGRSNRSELTSTVPAAQWEVARLQPTRYDATWKPAADATALRVIVHDVNSGRYGSVDVTLNKVPRDRPD
jgi:VWFA-related protein